MLNNLLNKNNNEYVYIFTLFSIFIIVYLTQYPHIIGFWEGTSIYKSFNPSSKPLLIFAIQKSADSTGFHGYFGYALISLSRYVSDYLGHSISVIKLMPFIYGICLIYILYATLAKYYAPLLGFIVSSILATNLTFIVFQKQLLSQIPTLMLIIICMNRFLNWDENPNKISALTFGLACSMLAQCYIVGRFCLIGILLISIVDLKLIRLGIFSIFSMQRLKNFIYFFIYFLLFLLILFPPNLIRLFNYEFIFTMIGENVTTSNTSYIETFTHNLKYLFLNFIYSINNETFPTDILIARPYRIINLILVPFIIYGIVITIKRINIKSFIFLYLGTIIFIIINLSLIYENVPFEISSTLISSMRTYFLIPFLIYFFGIGLYNIINKYSYSKGIKTSIILTFCVFLSYRIYAVIHESERFKKHIINHEYDFEKPAIEKEWNVEIWSKEYRQMGLINESILHADLFHKDKIKLHYNQFYFYNLAKYINTGLLDSTTADKYKIVYIPEDYYTPNYIQYGGGSTPWKGHPYYFPMYLTFYLQQNGLNISYLIHKDDVKGALPKRLIDVIDRYKMGKNEHNQFPKNKSEAVFLERIDKIISTLSEFDFVEKYVANLRAQKHYEDDATSIGKYFIVKTSNNNPEYLLITDEKQLENIQSISNLELVLKMPIKN